MKKRFLSLLMAFCLMLSLAPAAFAADRQPDTITLPNGEVREIPNAELDPIMPASVSDLEVDEEGYYVIKNEADFALVTQNEWYANKKFHITGDLDLTKLGNSVSEWNGYINYFYGTLEGVEGTYNGEVRYPKIFGIPNNCALIYSVIGGTIKNLIFEHKVDNTTKEMGSASFITFMPSTLGGKSYHLTMENVTVTGNISLTNSDQSNYAPFVYCAPSGGITMTNCVNDAKITGNIYGSVFHGYYPLFVGEACKYKFENCVNNGDVTMQYAGMFFGNSSSVEGKVLVDSLYLTITGCKNSGMIRGTNGAKYFAAPVSEFGSNMQAVEDVLMPLAEESTSTVVDTDNHRNIERVQIVNGGALCEGIALDGFAASYDGDTITVTRPTNETDVSYYLVSVGAYVKLWYGAVSSFYGTDRYAVTQRIDKGSIAATADNTFVPELKIYGFADSNVGTLFGVVSGQLVFKDSDNSLYYHVPNTPLGDGFTRYVSDAVNEKGQPVGGGTAPAEIVTVAAYKANGTMLDSVTVIAP